MGLTLSRELPGQHEQQHTPTHASPISNINHSWKHQQQNHHVRQASVRSRAAIPMPDHNELDKRFAKVLVSTKCIEQDETRLYAELRFIFSLAASLIWSGLGIANVVGLATRLQTAVGDGGSLHLANLH